MIFSARFFWSNLHPFIQTYDRGDRKSIEINTSLCSGNKLSAAITPRYLYAWRKLSSTLSDDSGLTYSNETFARTARYDKEIIQYTYQCIVIAIIRK